MSRVKQYYKKPPITNPIEAWQWDGTEEDAGRLLAWFNKFKAPHETAVYVPSGGGATDISYIQVRSGHISMTARVGDYVVWSSKSKSEPRKFQVFTQKAFEEGHYEVGTDPEPSSDEALEGLRIKLTGA